MIIRAKKLKILLDKYAVDKTKTDTYIYTWFRGVYDARIFNFCIFRNREAFAKLSEQAYYLQRFAYMSSTHRTEENINNFTRQI